MKALAERVSLVPANRTVGGGGRPADRRSRRELDGFFSPGGPGPEFAATARRCPTASPASTACTCEVTEAVRDELPTFENQAFVERLDVLFAEFYFQAYDAAAAEAWVSKAWAPLFARRAEHRLALQFAIAGMNAHINNDLAHALVLTWDELGFEPAATPRAPRLRQGQRRSSRRSRRTSRSRSPTP